MIIISYSENYQKIFTPSFYKGLINVINTNIKFDVGLSLKAFFQLIMILDNIKEAFILFISIDIFEFTKASFCLSISKINTKPCELNNNLKKLSEQFIKSLE